MILDYLEDDLDGNSWEELCDKCYRMRYQNDHFQKIPSIPLGDSGIEGFTRNGVTYQSYCPEKKYSDNELYEHLRDKMTSDISKLINLSNSIRLKSFGVPTIKEWHFVIPKYIDNRILVHAFTKQNEVLSLKKGDSVNYDYISEDFIIVIKVAEDFNIELTRIIRGRLTDKKLNLAISHNGKIDWDKCESIKKENIQRKIMAVGNYSSYDDDDYKEVVSIYIDAYIKGIELMNSLRLSFVDIYEEIYALEQKYKREVNIKSKINTNRELNKSLFNDIMDDFESKLNTQFHDYLTQASIFELKQDLIATWLADCSLEFKKR